MNRNKYVNYGGISIIILLILCLIIVFTFSVSNTKIRSVPEPNQNSSQIGGEVRNLWNDYLEKPVNYFWKNIFLKIFWASFISNMERIRDNKPTEFENMAPTYNPGN